MEIQRDSLQGQGGYRVWASVHSMLLLRSKHVTYLGPLRSVGEVKIILDKKQRVLYNGF